MKKIIILIALLPMLMSCGVSDERIDAYKKAARKVKKATSSESLEMIAYDLSKELYEIDREEVSLARMRILAKGGDEKASKVLAAIAKAKFLFDEALSDKEMAFYLERLSKKDK